MICILYRAKLFPFATGELDSNQHIRIHEHVQHCPKCQARVNEIRLLNSRMRAIAPMPFEPDGTLWSKLEVIIAPTKVRQPVSTGGLMSVGIAFASLAAITVVALTQFPQNKPVQNVSRSIVNEHSPAQIKEDTLSSENKVVEAPRQTEAVKAVVEQSIEAPAAGISKNTKKQLVAVRVVKRQPVERLTQVASAKPVKSPGVARTVESVHYITPEWMGPDDTTAVEPDDVTTEMVSAGSQLVVETIDAEDHSSAVERVYTAVEAKSKAIFWY